MLHFICNAVCTSSIKMKQGGVCCRKVSSTKFCVMKILIICAVIRLSFMVTELLEVRYIP
jgi:hypothetical protein